MKKGWVIMLLGMFLGLSLVSALTDTDTDGYLDIHNCVELQNMEGDLTANYELVNYIDCSDTINWNGGDGFASVGDNSNRFTGDLNGNDFEINGLYINKPSVNNIDNYYIGLFGSSSGTIKDIYLTDVNLSGYKFIGGLVGELYQGAIYGSYVSGDFIRGTRMGGLVGDFNGGEISTSYSIVNITSGSRVGGLVGFHSDGTILDSYSLGSVSGSTEVGGLVGLNWAGDILNSNSSCNVTGLWDVGGLVGYLQNGLVFNSHSVGDVMGNTTRVGGLIGLIHWGQINNSYSSGDVTVGDGSNVGGLVGYISYGQISNSYSSSNVSGGSEVGGLVGILYPSYGSSLILNSYSNGEILGLTNIGGLVGLNTGGGSVVNSYWDTENSGVPNSDGGTGKTTSEMKTQSTYIGWDFASIWDTNSSINNGYPFLMIAPEPTQQLIWQDMNSNEITTTNLGDSIKLVLTNATSGAFEIYEDDPINDDYIANITGSGVGNDLIGVWAITQEYLDKSETGDYDNFVFRIAGNESSELAISIIESNDPTNITILSPQCGSNLSQGESLSIEISVLDSDDLLTGTLTINGDTVSNLTNGINRVNHTFNEYGNIPLIANVEDNKGNQQRVVSNIMVVNPILQEKYIAACIDEPKNFDSTTTSTVQFKAHSSAGIECISGSCQRHEHNTKRLTYLWSFSTCVDSRCDGFSKTGNNPIAYDFTYKFPYPGSNWAKLDLQLN